MTKHCIEILALRYPQILLPIEEGISKSEEYRNVCLRGEKCTRNISFSMDPKDSLDSFNTIAGQVEVLTLRNRDDFIHACRCLGHKCEPVDIPDSTGAMAIFGLNNWEKVRSGLDNYKDSFIILSSGYYSNVDNTYIYKETNDINLSKEEWIDKSIIIRKYHELTHFIMRNLYPDDIDYIRDEIIADAIGIISAFGHFDIRLLNIFLGLEHDQYRSGGRLENYEGSNNIEEVRNKIKLVQDKLNKLNSEDVEYIWNHIKEIM